MSILCPQTILTLLWICILETQAQIYFYVHQEARLDTSLWIDQA
jgi:hypothetical protein